MIDHYVFAKGQIWECTEPVDKDRWDACITTGSRPVIIYSAIPTQGYVTVIPTAHNIKNKNGVLCRIGDMPCMILVSEIRQIPIASLTTFYGNLSTHKLNEIDSAMKVYLGMDDNPEIIKKYFRFIPKFGSLNDPITPFATVTDTKHPTTNPPDITPEIPVITQPSEKEKSVRKSKATTKIKKEPAPTKRTRTKLRLENMRPHRLVYIMKGDSVDNVAKCLDVHKSTIYNWRKILESDDTVIYGAFKNVSLINYTDSEKELFNSLDTHKLAETLNLPATTIETVKDGLAKDLNRLH